MPPYSEEVNVWRWDGASKTSSRWDGLRRDPDLWFPEGNCLVHLYAFGQSQRGPAFRIPFDAILFTNFLPLLDNFLRREPTELETAGANSNNDGFYYEQSSATDIFELYIPAPATTEREEAYIHHLATRNLFAWMLGVPLVGTHLGGALVGLLNSMDEWRSEGQENVQDLLDYMDEEGYADLRSSPDHALGLLFFAEHFRFRNLYIDAFAHCTGMYDELIYSNGYEPISRLSRALISRSKAEMDVRLDSCGRKLSTFLQDDLSDMYPELSAGARAHMDSFRSFLQGYYVAKLGYYPPTPSSSKTASFQKSAYAQMRSDFEQLYEFLADTHVISPGIDPNPAQDDGISVMEVINDFDTRHRYTALPHPLPLLPDRERTTEKKNKRRVSWFSGKTEKSKPDARLVIFSALSKASNRHDSVLYDSPLVRAYRTFEKDGVFSASKDKNHQISHTEARKVRWLVVYAMFQTLLSATTVHEQVRNTDDVPYELCVRTAGLPPWHERMPRTPKRSQSMSQPWTGNYTPSRPASLFTGNADPQLDSEYFPMGYRRDSRAGSIASLPSSLPCSRRGSVRRALSTLGTMPELIHPRPQRPSYHEIVVSGYGNGMNMDETTIISYDTPITEEEETVPQRVSSDLELSETEGHTSRWSSPEAIEEPETPGTDITSAHSRSSSKKSIKDFLDSVPGTNGLALRRLSSASSLYSVASMARPEPLQVIKTNDDGGLTEILGDARAEWSGDVSPDVDDEAQGLDEMLDYLACSDVPVR